jgi:hypothetical protein
VGSFEEPVERKMHMGVHGTLNVKFSDSKALNLVRKPEETSDLTDTDVDGR